MHRHTEPTTRQNAASRLFLRFLICYLAAVPIGLILSVGGLLPIDLNAAGKYWLLFSALALAGGLLTVAKPFLAVLTACKAFYDMALLLAVTRLAQAGSIGILPWNACFFLTIFIAVLFVFSAAQAALFSFLYTARDLRLIFSKPFGRYMLHALVILAVCLCLYMMWPQLCTSLGLTPALF